jgi:hypothetical protein
MGSEIAAVGPTDHQKPTGAQLTGAPKTPDDLANPATKPVAYDGATHRTADGETERQVRGCGVHANDNRVRAGADGDTLATKRRKGPTPAQGDG